MGFEVDRKLIGFGILFLIVLTVVVFASQFIDDTETEFDEGTYSNTEYNSTAVMLKYWNDSEQELPDNKGDDGYFDMTGNVLLLHMNNG